MKRWFFKALFLLTGNKPAQFILEKLFYITRMLMGQGSGSFPSSSGEKRVFEYLKEAEINLHAPLIVFDVGANKGQFLELVLDALSGHEFQVHCFEPVESAFSELVNLFGEREQVKLINLGLDATSQSSEIFYDEPGSLRASKFQRDLRHLGVHFQTSEVVDFTTLDQYCATNGIEQIDLLKIDVEGNELNVLKGAKDLLSQNAIGLITFEFGRAQVDSRTFFKDIYYYLASYNMKALYRILPSGYLKPIKEYDEKNEIFFTTNYLVTMR